MVNRPPATRFLGVLALASVVFGCSTPPPDAAADSGWDGRVSIDGGSGAITLDGFNEHIDREQPPWAAAPDTTVATALQVGRGEETPVPGEMKVMQSRSTHPTVRITFTDIPDDSVEAVRYELTLRKGDDELFRFDEGVATRRCRSGRGGIFSGGFGTGPCT